MNFALACLAVGAAGARAMDLPGVDDMTSLMSPRSLQKSNPLDAPSRDYVGVPWAGWMLYPKLLAGVVVDDNVYQTSQAKTSAAGVRVRPSLVAVYSNGIHKAALYGGFDTRFYPSQSAGNVYEGRLGGVYTYEMTRDLVFRVQGEASRHTDVFNDARVARAQEAPQRYNQYLGALSAQQRFGHLFTALGGTVLRKSYAEAGDAFGSLPDQTVTTVSGRVGYWMTPLFYGFVEPSANWRRFDGGAPLPAASYDSHGYRVVAGVGSDRISLFRGEVFSGYQQQRFDTPLFGDVSGGVFGGRLSWYPTRALTFGVQVDQTIAESLGVLGASFGSPTRVTATQVRADYALARSWNAQARVGFDRVAYVDAARRDRRWLAGATLNYDVFRNFGVALDYQYAKVDSNVALASYGKNVVTLGATYKY